MLGEQLLMSLKVMVLGIGTVFIALIALICVIELINKVLNSNKKNVSKGNEHSETEFKKHEVSVDGSATLNVPDATHDEEEIVAVIAAAVAASLNYSTHDIIVRSVRRVSSNTPVWNRVGRNQQIAGRL
ncbi:MAG: OadG family protein [Clostridiales bacterium]|nr:OadG family protein [Clostridiales bacterium]